MPKVSVVIPAYRAADKIGRAVESVGRQTFTDLEVIVVDDASQDDTAETATLHLKRSGLRHQIIVQPRNGGPAAARNAGVRAATGEYIAFLDADDYWLPEKLARQVAVLDADPDVTICGCQAMWVPSDGSPPFPLFHNLPDVMPKGWKILLWDCFIATPCAMVRQIDLGTAPFDTALRVGEDRDLWIKLASNGKVAVIQNVCVMIDLNPSSYMARHAMLIEQDAGPMIEKHLRAFSDLLGFREARLARGRIASQIGKALALDPATFARGSRYLFKAATLGYEPFDNLRHLALTAPVIRELKRLVKGFKVSRSR